MPEKFTPTEFKRTLKATTNEILEKNFAVHEAHEALRSFTNKEWRKVNEDVLWSRAKIVELQGNLGKIKMKWNAWKSYFNNEPDGDFGLKTLSALLLFQRDYWLEDDGIAGENTLKMIQKALLWDEIITPQVRRGDPSWEIQQTKIPQTLAWLISETIFIKFYNADGTYTVANVRASLGKNPGPASGLTPTYPSKTDINLLGIVGLS